MLLASRSELAREGDRQPHPTFREQARSYTQFRMGTLSDKSKPSLAMSRLYFEAALLAYSR